MSERNFYHNHKQLTAELWSDYTYNALQTEPCPDVLLARWSGSLPDRLLPGSADRTMGDHWKELQTLHAKDRVIEHYPAWAGPRIAHGALGLATELTEMRSVNTEEHWIEELGDACWYTALMLAGLQTLQFMRNATATPVQPRWSTDVWTMDFLTLDADTPVPSSSELISYGEQIVDDAKRVLCYDSMSKLPDVLRHSGQFLHCINQYAVRNEAWLPGGMAELLDKNSTKLLRKRYKDGFSTFAAEARADKAGQLDGPLDAVRSA
jgi:hypothetical protein